MRPLSWRDEGNCGMTVLQAAVCAAPEAAPAAERGALVRYLIGEAGADGAGLEDADWAQSTALHFAAMLDRRECVAALVTARIDVRRQDDAGMSTCLELFS